MRLLCLMAVVFFVVGCGKPTLDLSSEEKSKASIEKVKASLPEEEREAFEEAMMVVAFGSLGDNIFEIAANADNAEDKVKEVLHGKTGKEVIETAHKIRTEREARERKLAAEEAERQRVQAFEEIRELRQQVAAAEQAREQLARFEITRSRFYKQPQRFGEPQPIIELTVRNGTEHAISRAYMEGTLSSPGRSVPWHKDTFNYAIPGGLEPGEEANWHLAPNMFSDWGKVEMRPEMVFTVTLLRLDGPDGEPLHDASFDESVQKRLQALLDEYGNEAEAM